jgi:isocitrate dehydrogenase
VDVIDHPRATRRHPAAARPTDHAPARVVSIAGDGIGPEVSAAALRVLAAVCADLDVVDASVDRATGLPERAVFDELDRGAVLLKAPMTTPVGGGHKSPNVTLRKLLELYANVRPSRSIPGLPAPCGPVDLVIVRENVEDVYSGVEHAQTADVFQCLKLVSRSGSDAIARLAWDLADAFGRERVTCVTKSNIMKLTDGVLLEACRAESERRRVGFEHVLVDAAACDLVTRPERFDVIVTSNLYGDILSDLAAGLTGGLGIAPSMNVGAACAMFEPVHGSAPDIAGRDLANPTAMVLSCALMLRYLGDDAGARAVEQAVEQVYDAGAVRTADTLIAGAREVGCAAFADAIAERAALLVDRDAPISGPSFGARIARHDAAATRSTLAPARREVGVDVFVEWSGSVDELAAHLQRATGDGPLELRMITNRGLSVWPRATRARLVDHFRCRLVLRDRAYEAPTDAAALAVLARLAPEVRWMHVERLQEHDGVAAFSGAYGGGAA